MATEAQKAAAAKYKAANCKRIPLDVTTSQYAAIKAAAQEAGETVNGFLKKAAAMRIEAMHQPAGAKSTAKAANSPAVGVSAGAHASVLPEQKTPREAIEFVLLPNGNKLCTCVVCGKQAEFPAQHPSKYCSPECTKAAAAARAREARASKRGAK